MTTVLGGIFGLVMIGDRVRKGLQRKREKQRYIDSVTKRKKYLLKKKREVAEDSADVFLCVPQLTTFFARYVVAEAFILKYIECEDSNARSPDNHYAGRFSQWSVGGFSIELVLIRLRITD